MFHSVPLPRLQLEIYAQQNRLPHCYLSKAAFKPHNYSPLRSRIPTQCEDYIVSFGVVEKRAFLALLLLYVLIVSLFCGSKINYILRCWGAERASLRAIIFLDVALDCVVIAGSGD
jgi:hypothetical protein